MTENFQSKSDTDDGTDDDTNIRGKEPVTFEL